MTEIYLAHHGTKGMRWGIRRYQNKDGSLTDLGRRRLQSSDAGEKTLDEHGNIKPSKSAKASSLLRDEVSKDYKNAGSVSTNVGNLAKTASKLQKSKSDREVKEAISKIDFKSMSDDEIRQTVNRMNLERSYKQLMAERIDTGRSKTISRLETIGEVAAAGASVVGLLVAINELKKK